MSSAEGEEEYSERRRQRRKRRPPPHNAVPEVSSGVYGSPMIPATIELAQRPQYTPGSSVVVSSRRIDSKSGRVRPEIRFLNDTDTPEETPRMKSVLDGPHRRRLQPIAPIPSGVELRDPHTTVDRFNQRFDSMQRRLQSETNEWVGGMSDMFIADGQSTMSVTLQNPAATPPVTTRPALEPPDLSGLEGAGEREPSQGPSAPLSRFSRFTGFSVRADGSVQPHSERMPVKGVVRMHLPSIPERAPADLVGGDEPSYHRTHTPPSRPSRRSDTLEDIQSIDSNETVVDAPVLTLVPPLPVGEKELTDRLHTLDDNSGDSEHSLSSVEDETVATQATDTDSETTTSTSSSSYGFKRRFSRNRLHRSPSGLKNSVSRGAELSDASDVSSVSESESVSDSYSSFGIGQQRKITRVASLYRDGPRQWWHSYKSLYIFPRDSPTRVTLMRWTSNRKFEYLMLFIILVNCVFLAVDDPTTTSDDDIQYVSDVIFTVLYTIEMVMKVIALGFVIGYDTYLRNPWNILDFIVVVPGLIALIPGAASGNLTALRSVRLLRPLRSIKQLPALRKVVHSLVRSIKLLGHVASLFLFFFTVFGILGVQLFGGRLKQRCQNDSSLLDTDDHCSFSGGTFGRSCDGGETCVVWDENPYNNVLSFDNFGNAVIALFQMTTLEGWTDVMYRTGDATTSFSYAFFVAFVILGAFFALNLIIAILQSAYDSQRMSRKKKSNRHKSSERIARNFARKQRKRGLVHAMRSSKGSFKKDGRSSKDGRFKDGRKTSKDGRSMDGVRDLLKKRRVRVFPPAAPPSPPCASHPSPSVDTHGCSGDISDARRYTPPPPPPPPGAIDAFSDSQYTPPSRSSSRGGPSPPRIPPIITASPGRRANRSPASTSRSIGSGQGRGRPYARSLSRVEGAARDGSVRLPGLRSSHSRSPASEQRVLSDMEASGSESPMITSPVSMEGFSRVHTAKLFRSATSSFLHRDTTTDDTKMLKPRNRARKSSIMQSLSNMSFSGLNKMSHRRVLKTLRQQRETSVSGSTSMRSAVAAEWEADSDEEARNRMRCGDCRRPVRRLVMSRRFEQIMILLVILNLLVLCFNYEGISEGAENAINLITGIFTFIFAVEIGLKMAGLGLQFFRNMINVVDMIVVVGSAVEFMLTSRSTYAALRTIDLFRFFTLGKDSSHPFLKKLYKVWRRLQRALLAVRANFVIFVLMLFIYALMGMQFFGGKMFDRNGDRVRYNFDSMYYSFTTVVQIATLEDWPSVLYTAVDNTSYWAVLYFVTLVVICSYVLLSLFLAILLSFFATMTPVERFFARQRWRVAARMVLEKIAEVREKADSSAPFVYVWGTELPNVKQDMRLSNTVVRALTFHRSSSPRRSQTSKETPVEPDSGSVVVASDDIKDEGVGEVEESFQNRSVNNEALAAVRPSVAFGSSHVPFEPSQMDDEKSSGSPGRIAPVPRPASPKATLHTIRVTPVDGEATIVEALNLNNQDAVTRTEERNRIRQEALMLSAVARARAKEQGTGEMERVGANGELKFERIDALSGSRWIDVHQNDCFTCCQGPRCGGCRRSTRDILVHRHFNKVLLGAIALSCLLVAIDNPQANKNRSTALTAIVRTFDILFSVVFTTEIVMKMSVYGVRRYLSNAWDVLDVCVVLFGVIGSVARIWKASQSAWIAFRPLRLIRFLPGVRDVATAIVKAIPSTIGVLVLGIFMLFMYGLVGVQLWKGKFYQCVYDPSLDQAACIAGLGAQDPAVGWRRYPYHFDNIAQAMLTMFQVSAVEGWPEIMRVAIDTTTVGQEPRIQNNPMVAFIFVSFIMVWTYVVLNLFSGVIVEQFSEKRRRQLEEHPLTTVQRQWIRIHKLILATHVPKRAGHQLDEDSCSAQLYVVVSSHRFQYFVLGAIVFNTLVMAAYYVDMSDEQRIADSVINLILAIVFVVEVLLKLGGLGRAEYFNDRWNMLDFVVTVLSFMGEMLILATDWGSILTVFRVIRLFRLLRIVREFKSLARLFSTLYMAFTALIDVVFLFIIVFYIYAVAGMSIFGDVKEGEYINEHANYRSLGRAFLLHFRMITGEGWNGVMNDCRVLPPDCTLGQDCGTWAAIPFFTSNVIVCSYVMLNAFLAVVLSHFGNNHELIMGYRDIENFSRQWQRLASQETPHLLSVQDLMKLLLRLNGVLRLDSLYRLAREKVERDAAAHVAMLKLRDKKENRKKYPTPFLQAQLRGGFTNEQLEYYSKYMSEGWWRLRAPSYAFMLCKIMSAGKLQCTQNGDVVFHEALYAVGQVALQFDMPQALRGKLTKERQRAVKKRASIFVDKARKNRSLRDLLSPESMESVVKSPAVGYKRLFSWLRRSKKQLVLRDPTSSQNRGISVHNPAHHVYAIILQRLFRRSKARKQKKMRRKNWNRRRRTRDGESLLY